MSRDKFSYQIGSGGMDVDRNTLQFLMSYSSLVLFVLNCPPLVNCSYWSIVTSCKTNTSYVSCCIKVDGVNMYSTHKCQRLLASRVSIDLPGPKAKNTSDTWLEP